jgi:hypothetical protein
MLDILQQLGPEALVGGCHLPLHATGQLGGQAIAGTELSIHAFVEFGDAAGFALLKSRATHRIERISVGQLGHS